MRAVELERMAFLRTKAKTEGLSEKENERLRSLEAKEFAEKQKEGKANGGNQNAGGEFSGNDSQTNASNGNRKDGGKESRKGEGAQRANGNEPTSTPRGTGGADGGRTGTAGTSNRGNGAKGDQLRGSDDGSYGDSGSDDGTDRGTEAGSIGGSIGDTGQEKGGSQRVPNLRPNASVKPKKKPLGKKKSNELDADLIGGLLMSGFGLIAKTTGRPHWEITEDEATSVAEPMEFLIENMTAKQKKAIEKYSNPIMLASAVAGIVVPRIMVDMALMNQRKVKAKGGVTHVASERTIEAVIDGDTQRDFKLGTVQTNGGDSDGGKVSTPVNDPVLAGLLK